MTCWPSWIPPIYNLQLRSAQVNLKNAQDHLAQTKNPNTQQDIANARAQLDSAQAAYDKLAAGAARPTWLRLRRRSQVRRQRMMLRSSPLPHQTARW